MPDTKIDIAELRKRGPETELALKIADAVLDRPMGDPDDDLATLSRQLMRAWERIDKQADQLEQSQRETELRQHHNNGWQARAEASESRVAELTAEVERKDAVIQAMDQVTVGPLSYTAMRAERDASQALVARLRGALEAAREHLRTAAAGRPIDQRNIILRWAENASQAAEAVALPKLVRQPTERAARAICEIHGRDPDEIAPLGAICGPSNEPLPWWRFYEEDAIAACSAFPDPPTTHELRAAARQAFQEGE